MKPLVDYKKIKLENERSTHLTKRPNNLTTWKFFKVLYRDCMGRMYLLNFMMLLFIVPMLLVAYFTITSPTYQMSVTLPSSNFLSIGSSVWLDVGTFSAAQNAIIQNNGHIYVCAAAILVAFAFAGGFAVIRDSFWTGKITVWKPFWKGVGATIGYTLAGTAVIAGGYLGIYFLGNALTAALPQWAYIICMVLAWALYALLFLYIYTMFAVASTYKQTVAVTLADSWRILWLNFLPNVVRLIITAIPIGLYFLFGANGGILGTLILAAAFLFGMFYIVFIYMTNMMRTFALFHPVTPTKKNAPTK